jgi:hypothetical protein
LIGIPNFLFKSTESEKTISLGDLETKHPLRQKKKPIANNERRKLRIISAIFERYIVFENKHKLYKELINMQL